MKSLLERINKSVNCSMDAVHGTQLLKYVSMNGVMTNVLSMKIQMMNSVKDLMVSSANTCILAVP